MKKNTNIFEKGKGIDIVACFTRSFDKSHIDNNKIHLISSVIQINTDEIKKEDADILKNVAGKLSGSKENFYYFYVLADNGEIDWLKEAHPNIKRREGYYYREFNGVYVIFLSLDVLIGFFNINTSNSEIFENIFGHKNLIRKDFEVISPNCLFHFRNLFWSNILLKFKMAGIHISGGSISKRHILKTIEFQLISLLYLFFNSDSMIIKNIYSNYNNDVLSSTIPLDLYNKSLDITKDLSFLKNSEENKIFHDLKFLDSDFCDLIRHNYHLSILTLTENILEIYNSEIYKLKEKLINLQNENSQLEYKINNLEELPYLSLRHLKNKEKKKIKKQRTLMINSKFDYEISEMKKKIPSILVQIEELESEISKRENEVKKFNETFVNKNILELNNLYDSLTKNRLKFDKFTKRYTYTDFKFNNGFNYNIRKFSTILSYKDNFKDISIPSNSLIYQTKQNFNFREYSTNYINNNFLSDSISLDISKDSLIFDKFEQSSLLGLNKDKISNEISIYFKLIYNILQNDSINTIEKQIQIEKL